MLRIRSFFKKNQGFTRISHCKNNTETGNALWFILIAIVLLGLLTTMLSRSSSNSDDTGSYENANIVANEMLNYAKSIEVAVKNLQARGCGEQEISFDNAVVAGYSHSESPTDLRCHIFEPEGAGMTFQLPPEGAADDYIFQSSTQITDLGRNAAFSGDTRGSELIIAMINVDLEVCKAINRISGLDPDPVTDQIYIIFTTDRFVADYETHSTLGSSFGDPPNLDRKHTGCFFGDAIASPIDQNHAYHVLMVR